MLPQVGADERRTFLRSFLAGGLAGAVSRTAVAPLTVVKSVAQLVDAGSWREVSRRVYRAGGARMFWLGNVPGLIRIFPHAGLKFAGYEVLSRHVTMPSAYRGRFVAGMVSGGVASALLYPLDVLKSRVTVFKFSHLAARRPVPPMAWLAAGREMWQQGGVAGSMRGVGASIVGSGLHNGFLFLGYYSVRSWWGGDRLAVCCAGGVLAGGLAQITYPFDLIRRTALHQNLHSYDAALVLLHEGGLLGLYRGSVANLAKVLPLFGIQFLAYELLIQHILI